MRYRILNKTCLVFSYTLTTHPRAPSITHAYKKYPVSLFHCPRSKPTTKHLMHTYTLQNGSAVMFGRKTRPDNSDNALPAITSERRTGCKPSSFSITSSVILVGHILFRKEANPFFSVYASADTITVLLSEIVASLYSQHQTTQLTIWAVALMLPSESESHPLSLGLSYDHHLSLDLLHCK